MLTLREGCTALMKSRAMFAAPRMPIVRACDGKVTLGLRVNASGIDLDLRLDLDRNAERQFGHADRGTRVTAALRTIELEDEVRKSVDDQGLLIEARSGVHHSEHPEPRGHAVEIAELALQAPENRERGQARRVLRLLERHGEADLPQRTR